MEKIDRRFWFTISPGLNFATLVLVALGVVYFVGFVGARTAELYRLQARSAETLRIIEAHAQETLREQQLERLKQQLEAAQETTESDSE